MCRRLRRGSEFLNEDFESRILKSFSSEFHSFGRKWVGNLCKLDFLQSFVTMLFVLVEIDFWNILEKQVGSFP